MPTDTASPTLEVIGIERKRYPFRHRLRISGRIFEHTDAVVVTLGRGGVVGRGEASGVYYLGDDVDHICEQIASFAKQLPNPLTRDALRGLLPAGGARNAIDCALWDLEAKETGRPAWAAAGLPRPKPCRTAITLSAELPAEMANRALALSWAGTLKLKLTGDADTDFERIAAVRAVRPDCWLGVDANQGYTPATIDTLLRAVHDFNVDLLEQPMARGRDDDLIGLKSSAPIAADESCLDLGDIEGMVGRFDVINIKLDKCGGLTEGLDMARYAKALGLDVMVGNMAGSSLSVAPGFLLAQLCDFVDLDAAYLLAEDVSPSVSYEDGVLRCPEMIWGYPVASAV